MLAELMDKELCTGIDWLCIFCGGGMTLLVGMAI